MMIQDPISYSITMEKEADFHNSSAAYEQQLRLDSLAARENTVIDNPYQSSHIKNNWTRDSINIQKMHSSYVKEQKSTTNKFLENDTPVRHH